MMLGSFGIGRWLGFRIRIDVSWFLVLVLVTWTFAAWELPGRLPGLTPAGYLALGLAAALLLFLSVLLHEISHSVVARSRGIGVERITLFLFGGVAEMTAEPRRPGDEFALTIAGPLASLALAGVFGLAGRLAAAAGLDATATLAGILAWLNLVLAVFNMVPAFPLDGGRILRAAIWKATGDLGRATRWSAYVGRAFGWFLIGSGLLLFLAGFRVRGLQGAQISGAWMILLGWFLNAAATSAVRYERVRRGLEGVTVGDVLRPGPGPLPAAASAADLARVLLGAPGAGGVAVVRGGEVVGAATAADVAGVRAAARPETPVFELMRPAVEVPALEAETSLEDALSTLRARAADRAFVLRDGVLLGVFTTRAASRWLERLREMGVEPSEVDSLG
ncbi:MAG: site-2 protease family protein [Gemmatimonadota bacterium]|nr:site-2 protease family protein [Gemmatimonadota bacterium]